MILLKATALTLGLFGPISTSVDHTVMPSIGECRSYLQYSADRWERANTGTVVTREENSVNAELHIRWIVFNSFYECIEVK